MSRVLFTGGPIITFDGSLPTSIAIDGDRITAIGDEASSWATTFDEVVQLEGRCVVPAFRDGHAHPLHAGINRNELDLTGVPTFDDVIERVRQWADAHPQDPWIVGHCYSPPILPNGVGRAEWLDAACPDRPVVLFPTDYHALWANERGASARRRVPVDPRPVARHDRPRRRWATGRDAARTRRDGSGATAHASSDPGQPGAWTGRGDDRPQRRGDRVGTRRSGRPRRARRVLRWRSPGTADMPGQCGLQGRPPLVDPPARWVQRCSPGPRGRCCRVSVGRRPHREVLRRWRDRGGHRLPARALRGRSAHLRAAELGGGSPEGSGAHVRRGRLSDPHPRHRRRRCADGARCDRARGATTTARPTAGR